MPLPLLGSIAAGHRTIRFLLRVGRDVKSGRKREEQLEVEGEGERERERECERERERTKNHIRLTADSVVPGSKPIKDVCDITIYT
jgi:hypothetical protein